MLYFIRQEHEHAFIGLQAHGAEIVLAFCYAGDEPRTWDRLGKHSTTELYHSPPRSLFTRDTRKRYQWLP